MTKIMNPSAKAKKMTARQTDKAVANYRAMLEKHAPEFEVEAVQKVLGMPELAGKMFGLFRQLVEMVANMIVRLVTVNRQREPMEAIKATGRKFYGEEAVVKAMPRGEGAEVEVVFFKPTLSGRNGLISDDDLVGEYERRDLDPADAYSLAAVNEADPAFADEHPNATHWKDAQGNWCYAAFDRWLDRRDVSVNRLSYEWDGHWWFAGLRKKP